MRGHSESSRALPYTFRTQKANESDRGDNEIVLEIGERNSLSLRCLGDNILNTSTIVLDLQLIFIEEKKRSGERFTVQHGKK